MFSYSFLEYISITSKDVVRKVLYDNIVLSFKEVDTQFEELCNNLYAETINAIKTEKIFVELADTLLQICNKVLNYTNQQMEVIGADKDCDIKFINDKLVHYQLNIKELKGGITERRNNTIRFTSDYAKRNLIIPKLDTFLSLVEEIESNCKLLQQAYHNLYDTIYSNEEEVVINRFNKQFKNVVAQVAETSDSYLEELSNLCKKHLSSQRSTKKNNHVSGFSNERLLHEMIFKVVDDTIGNEFYSACDKPVELARTIQKNNLDNEKVNSLFALIAIVGNPYGVDNLSSQPRGRPPSDFCYVDYVGRMKEILETCPVDPTKKLTPSDCKLFNRWLVALFVTWGEFDPSDLYGYISAFWRFCKQIGFEVTLGLRYLQKKIAEFRDFIRCKSKGGFYDYYDKTPTKSWARKLKRFAPLEKFKEIISEKFIQFQRA